MGTGLAPTAGLLADAGDGDRSDEVLKVNTGADIVSSKDVCVFLSD